MPMDFSKRVPLFSTVQSRDGDIDHDFNLKNCYPERIFSGKSGDTEENVEWIVKRPGLSSIGATQTGAARGSYYWKKTGKVYFVVGNKVYSINQAETIAELTSATLQDSTGIVYFTEQEAGSPGPKLFINDPDNDELYTINASETITRQTSTQPTRSSNAATKGVACMDGYLFLVGSTNNMFIQASTTAFEAANDVTWTLGDVIRAQLYPAQGMRIIRHLNYVALFTDKSIEFFYNAGADPGILGRAEGTVRQVGCNHPDTIVSYADALFFVAHTGQGLKVGMLDGLQVRYISTIPVEKIMQSAINAMDNARAYVIDNFGQILYVLRLPGISKTLVYCVKSNMWVQFTHDTGAAEGDFTFGYPAYNADNQRTYMIHESTGEIFRYDQAVYQDDGQDINVDIVTNRLDFETNQIKFLHYVGLTGDRQTAASNITMYHSDDDYKSWVTKEAVDSQNELVWRSCGCFSRRAFKFTHVANTAMRVNTIELGMTLGDYAQGTL